MVPPPMRSSTCGGRTSSRAPWAISPGHAMSRCQSCSLVWGSSARWLGRRLSLSARPTCAPRAPRPSSRRRGCAMFSCCAAAWCVGTRRACRWPAPSWPPLHVGSNEPRAARNGQRTVRPCDGQPRHQPCNAATGGKLLTPSRAEIGSMQVPKVPPILAHKHYAAVTAFTPENLLREARRQTGLPQTPVPQVCVLDPDGDIVRQLRAAGRAQQHPGWACYHTELYRFSEAGLELGLVGCAVGAAFAVLIAEQLFASGCRLLISMTSAGQLAELRPPPYFILIEKAWRDEGTSYHYLPPAEFSDADPKLLEAMIGAFAHVRVPVERGATWTTDAPFRETQASIDATTARGLLAVEMEAAALYAFAKARGRSALCFAHVTNQMALIDGDFEKGEADGTVDALAVICAAAEAWRRSSQGAD